MDEKDKIIADQGTQIVLIHRELKSITAYIENIEKSLTTLGSMDKTLGTQQNILESQERRLMLLEKEVADSRTLYLNMSQDMNNRMQAVRDTQREDRYTGQNAILGKIDEVIKAHDTRFKEKEDRIRALENWRWYIIGIMAAAGLVLSGIPWKIVFAQ